MSAQAQTAVHEIVRQADHLRDRIRASGSSHDESARLLDETVEELYTMVEELQIANEELRLSLLDLEIERSRYRDLFHQSQDGLLLADAAGTVTLANRPAGQLAGRDAEALVGRSLVDLVVPGGRAEAAYHVRKARYGGRGGSLWTLRCAGGGSRLVQVSYRPLAGADDGPAGSQWLVVDLERPLFEDEDREVDTPAVARRWLALYEQLAAGTEALAADGARRAEQLVQPARAAFEEAQTGPLDARLARVRQGLAFWRRRHQALVHLDFDLVSPEVRHRERVVHMTLRERQLLQAMMAHPGRSLSASALLVQAWHSRYLAEEQLRTYVVRLRKKLLDLRAPCRVVNHRGKGYALVFDEPESD